MKVNPDLSQINSIWPGPFTASLGKKYAAPDLSVRG